MTNYEYTTTANPRKTMGPELGKFSIHVLFAVLVVAVSSSALNEETGAVRKLRKLSLTRVVPPTAEMPPDRDDDITSKTVIQDDDDNIETGKKILYAIRHGKSTANEYMAKEGSTWGAPTFYDDTSYVDAPLSEEGRAQAAQLAKRLARQQTEKDPSSDPTDAGGCLSEVELILVSPLTRCLETFHYGVRPAYQACGLKCPKVVILPLITERVYTSSDTGLSLAELKKIWGEDGFDWSHAESLVYRDRENEETPWWYHQSSEKETLDYKEWRPYGEGQYYAVPGEPKEVFEDRMKKAEMWIHDRSESRIMLVCHWAVLHHWTGEPIENCGFRRIEWDSNNVEVGGL